MQVLELAFSIEKLVLKSNITGIDAHFVRKMKSKDIMEKSRMNKRSFATSASNAFKTE